MGSVANKRQPWDLPVLFHSSSRFCSTQLEYITGNDKELCQGFMKQKYTILSLQIIFTLYFRNNLLKIVIDYTMILNPMPSICYKRQNKQNNYCFLLKQHRKAFIKTPLSSRKKKSSMVPCKISHKFRIQWNLLSLQQW